MTTASPTHSRRTADFRSTATTLVIGAALSFGTNALATEGHRNGHGDRKSTRLNSSHTMTSRMPSSA